MEKGINLIGEDNVYHFGSKIISVLELHRKIQNQMDSDDSDDYAEGELNITCSNPSYRYTDFIITIIPPYNLTPESFNYLNKGAIFQYGILYDLGVNNDDLIKNHQKNIMIIQDRM